MCLINISKAHLLRLSIKMEMGPGKNLKPRPASIWNYHNDADCRCTNDNFSALINLTTCNTIIILIRNYSWILFTGTMNLWLSRTKVLTILWFQNQWHSTLMEMTDSFSVNKNFLHQVIKALIMFISKILRLFLDELIIDYKNKNFHIFILYH